MGNVLSSSEQSPEARQRSGAVASQRAAVEEALRAEGAALAAIIDLLKAATPLAAWPTDLRRALLAALTETDEGVEAQKARWLRRRLFRQAHPALPAQPWSMLSPLEQRIAERVRADLPGLTPLGSGAGLLL